jgi:predicted nucleic acid-binding protein
LGLTNGRPVMRGWRCRWSFPAEHSSSWNLCTVRAGASLRRQLYLIDTSALARRHHPEILGALESLNEIGRLTTCAPLMLELGYTARSSAAHDEIAKELIARMDVLLLAPEMTAIAYDLQRRLFAASKGRAVGSFDLMVTAHVVHHTRETSEVTIVHYDADYDHLASVAPELRCRWVVPRGSVA